MHDTFSRIDAGGVETSELDRNESISSTEPQPLQSKLLIIDDDLRCAHFFSAAAKECGYAGQICGSHPPLPHKGCGASSRIIASINPQHKWGV